MMENEPIGTQTFKVLEMWSFRFMV